MGSQGFTATSPLFYGECSPSIIVELAAPGAPLFSPLNNGLALIIIEHIGFAANLSPSDSSVCVLILHGAEPF